ncbi:hypothetical protein [Thalassomonas actiniarum]|uniref:6-bladed beta-propeller n=1 Tax=Thalassomonas actiniarum TaxID=485447 RepID=A0AAF0C324_9GAMM|nr:hypothetical protein [Thalassomonas actiniarum]WDD98528.1 hypothetical protein SG35_025280 [Thalassomonas actiniarum]
MDRRRFIVTSSAVAGTLALPVKSFAMAEASKGLNKVPDNSRLPTSKLTSLGIQAPLKQVTAPGGHDVSFPLKMRVARQYRQKIYVWFETEPMIRVYDLAGNEQSPVSLPDSVGILKDFALDSMDNIFILSAGQHQITWLGPQGDMLGYIGDFGMDLAEQLNGPASLTLDSEDHLHVLNAGSRTIKVYKNNGVFLFEYGQSRWGKERKLLSLDGTDTISASGGIMKDSRWHFSPSGQMQ